jgi:toxin-antitoxin system PIN domain toxin
MILPDANLLLYAYDRESPFHDKAKNWWRVCLSGRESVGLALPVVFAFVRIATSPHGFEQPMTLQNVRMRIDSWLKRSVVKVLQPNADHIGDVLDLLAAMGSAGGNLTTDAQIAALALSHRAIVHTADHDYRRFPGLKCHYPLD